MKTSKFCIYSPEDVSDQLWLRGSYNKEDYIVLINDEHNLPLKHDSFSRLSDLELWFGFKFGEEL